MSLSVQIHTGDIAEELRALAAGLEPAVLSLNAARSVVRALQDHFGELEATRPNRLGGRRTNFWAGVGDRVQAPEPQGNAAVISINRPGLALRRFGGVVQAGKGISSFTGRPTQFLAYPAVAAAHGKRPSEFSNLEVGTSINSRGQVQLALVEKTAPKLKGPRGNSKKRAGSPRSETRPAIFWLAKTTRHAPDPTVLPTDAQLEEAGRTGIEEVLHDLRNQAS